MTNDSASAGQVLVIEDDADIQEFLQFVLEDAGYTVLRAWHGAAALTVLRQADRLPDLIVLDLQMPRLDGRAFRRAQQADPRWRTIPVILMSASTGFGTAARELDVATIIRKPFPPDDLVAHVAQVCAAAPARAA